MINQNKRYEIIKFEDGDFMLISILFSNYINIIN